MQFKKGKICEQFFQGKMWLFLVIMQVLPTYYLE